MLVRAIALSLALLIGGTVIIPLATDNTEAGPRHKRKKQRKHYKKYSKRWWKQYRARQRRLKAIRARKRAIRLRNLRLGRQRAAEQNAATSNSRPQIASATKSPRLPSRRSTPEEWKPANSSPAELQFRVDNSFGDQIGLASISVVGPASPNASFPMGRSVGGVSTSALRRDVIDRMVRENGWVLNDYQKEISGQDVYVVVAQSQAKSGVVQSRMFYFTEVDGKVYSVTTNSPVQEQERLAEESEKVINSLKSRVRPGTRAGLQE